MCLLMTVLMLRVQADDVVDNVLMRGDYYGTAASTA